MKIAVFTNNYLPNPFGVSSSIESFRKEFEKAGHTVYVFAPKVKGYVDENPGVFRYPSVDINYKISFPLAIPFSKRIEDVLEKLDIDLIHSQHPNLLGWAAKKWAKKKNVPLVFTWHTLYDQYTHFAPPFVPKKLASWWVIGNARRYADEADFVVTPTDSVKRIVQKWGVKNKNIVSIPTGVSLERFEKADKDLIRKKHDIPDDKKIIVLVSRFTEEKNIAFVFRSLKAVLKKREDVVFVAKGNGNLLSEMKEFAKKNDLAGKIIFADDERVEDVFSGGDVFVYASKSETQGMVISEALISGLPVVAVGATGVLDQVLDGASGFLTGENEEEFGKAVERILNDEEMRKRFSENARKIALENYTSEICAKKMLDLYGKVIEGKKQTKDL